MQVQVENTFFYNLPDGRTAEGVSGTAAPYPISVQNQRSYNSFQEFIFLKELLLMFCITWRKLLLERLTITRATR